MIQISISLLLDMLVCKGNIIFLIAIAITRLNIFLNSYILIFKKKDNYLNAHFLLTRLHFFLLISLVQEKITVHRHIVVLMIDHQNYHCFIMPKLAEVQKIPSIYYYLPAIDSAEHMQLLTNY